MFLSVKIRDGAGDFEDAVVTAGGKAESIYGVFQQRLGIGFQLAVFPDMTWLHVSVAEYFLFRPEPRSLVLARRDNFGAHGCGIFPRTFLGKLFVGQCWYLNVYVDAIEERAGNAGHVFLNLLGRTGACVP